ncbi:MAG: RDD family protein [Dermatophilaceae bacterium]
MSDIGAYRGYATDDLVTGEGVAVEVPAASVAARAASGLLDLLVVVALMIGGSIAASVLTAESSDAVVGAVFIAVSLAVFVGVPLAQEVLFRGRTLGKLALGLRVVRDDGGPAVARHALVRALVGYVEVYLLFGVPALVAGMIHPRAKRLGDMAAGTYVVSQRARLTVLPPPPMPPSLEHWAVGADIAALPSGLTVALRQFLGRAAGLAPESRRVLGTDLFHSTMRYVSPPPPQGAHPELVMAAVVAERRRRDTGRLWREEQLRTRVLPPDPLG